MKKIILVGAIALLAACGSTKNDASGGTGADNSTAGSSPAAVAPGNSSGDTISVDNFGDMPPKCIELLGGFLKKIEPTVSTIDWDKATLADFEQFGKQFQTETDAFDSQTSAAGCDKYNLSGSDEQQFAQMAELASAEAPGTLGFIKFLGALSASATATGESIPADCAGTIALVEPYLANGTMKDLTMAQVTSLGQLMNGVSENCTPDEASAFFTRADVSAFISG
ncbi:MAG: hypothetical protein ABI706_17910 [Ilumatobacteraceae bacterium]